MAEKLNGLLSPTQVERTIETPITWSTTAGAPVSYDSVSLAIENNVNPTNKYQPLTGVYATEIDIDGWIWDRRRLENERLTQTQYDTFLGGHEHGLTDGTSLAQWQSGSNRGTEYRDLAHYRDIEFLSWTPRVRSGSYSLYHDRRPLYSDYSYTDSFSTDAIDNGVMWHQLRDDAVYSTIDVAMYARDTAFRIWRRLNFNYVDEFTGQISGAERLATTDSEGNILWDNLETRKHEFTIKDGKVWLNNDWSISVGDGPNGGTLNPVAYPFMEYAGAGVNDGRDIYTKLLPVQEGSVRVFSKDAANNAIEWTERDNLNFSISTDYHFSVDYDLGIITMGGFQAPDLVLSEALEESDTEITVYIDDDAMEQYPDQGILVIGTEWIAYYNKTRNGFYNLIRGYSNTTATEHEKGVVVQDMQHGQGTDDSLYVSYTAVPRIDYEVTEHELRSSNRSPWLDIRPGTNIETNNVLQILSADISLHEVVLETDTLLIGGELHGPLFYGSDVSELTARGLDALGNPVQDVELTIELQSGPGRLNGFNNEYTNITNTLGEIYAFYNSPYDKEHIEKTVSSVTHVGANTEMVVDGLLGDTELADIWVFQILKHDKVTGTLGDKLDITAAAASTGDIAGLYPGYIDVDGIVSQDMRDGYLIVVGTGGIQYTRDILLITEEEDGSGQPYSRIYMNNTLNSGLVTGQTVRLYEPEATEWDPNVLNGTRHVLYEWRDDVEHPITGLLGAWYPLQPDAINGNTLTFNDRNLPIPDPHDDTSNLGAYVVVANGRATLQAYGRDPVSGRVIRSNTIKLQLELPSSLIGVDTSGALPVPVGWTFATEEFNIGSGIGGANFITINPAADGINQFSLLGTF